MTHTAARSRERGQSSLLLVFLTAVLLVVATTIIVTAGRGMTVETRARTAADAAALAGAEAITERLDTGVDTMPGNDGLALGHLLQLLRLTPDQLTEQARPAASSLAAQNGSTLTGLQVVPTLHGYEVRATVRSVQRTTETSSRRPSFDATAEVRITDGLLCLRNGRVGLFLGGSCAPEDDLALTDPTLPPPEPVDPDDPEAPPAEPVPDVPWVFDGEGTGRLLDLVRDGLTWHVALTE